MKGVREVLDEVNKNSAPGTGGTESTILQRNNTCTTFISMKKKSGNRLSGHNFQLPVRSVSLRNSCQNNSRRSRNVMDDPI